MIYRIKYSFVAIIINNIIINKIYKYIKQRFDLPSLEIYQYKCVLEDSAIMLIGEV